MDISELISPERVICDAPVASKKRVLELLGELIAGARDGLDARAIFDSLLGRERLGSTGLGHGVALPHGRLAQSTEALGAFVKLEDGIDFDAIDRAPVHLVFALLVPEHFTDEHLKILAFLAEMFSDHEFCDRLRQASDDAELYRTLSSWRPDS